MRYEQHYQTHMRIFDSVEDLIESCQAVRSTRYIDGNSLNRQPFVGRHFSNWSQVFDAAREPWDDGLEIIDRMVRELQSVDLPKPQSRRRRPRFNEDDGDELDYDRLRTGQPFWRTTQRESTRGPQTVTIVIDQGTRRDVDHDDIMWRGAAAIAMTQILEAADFRVELWTASCCNDTYKDGSGHCNAVCLKRPGDPLDVATLAAAVSGWFYRSMMFRAKSLNAAPKSRGLGKPRTVYANEAQEFTGDPNAIIIARVFDEWAAIWTAKQTLKRLAGIEDPPPPPPVDVEPEPMPKPEPPKPKTKAELRAEAAAQRKADREWRAWLKQREKENVEC
jgi:hypothetical protein